MQVIAVKEVVLCLFHQISSLFKSTKSASFLNKALLSKFACSTYLKTATKSVEIAILKIVTLILHGVTPVLTSEFQADNFRRRATIISFT